MTDAKAVPGGPATKRPGLGPVLLTVLLDLLGFGLVIPLLAFYAKAHHATDWQVLLLGAVYSLAQFVGAPVWGLLSDRYGRRPVLLATILGNVVFLTAFGMATSLWQLFLFRTLHGLAAANISTAQAYVADVTEGADRARGMGLIGAAFGVGFSLGPFVGGVMSDAYGLSAPIFLAAALSAVNLIWVAARLPESLRPGARAEGHARTLDPRALLEGLRHPVVGLAIFLVFVATFAFSMMEQNFALVAREAWSMGARDVGYLFGLIGLIGIVVQGGMIRPLVKRFGEPALIGVGYLLNAIGTATIGTSGPGAGVWIGCAVLAVGSSLANPSLNTLISRATPADEQGAVLGTSQSFASLARGVGPLTAAGLVLVGWRPAGAMLLGAGLMLGALILSIPATRRATAAVS
jgi:multidrug resistance protein